jgi:hypothetical protein
VIPAAFDYQRPASIEEALAIIGSDPGAKLLAGGQSLLPLLKLRLGATGHLVDIGRIPGLEYIHEEGGFLKIGAFGAGLSLADMLRLTDLSSISKHLSYLQKLGVVKTIRTGRESIYILGEWHKPQGWNVSKEFYYLENRFGDRKSDLEEISGSDLNTNQNSSERSSRSDMAPTADLSWRKNHAINREENREMNTVNGLKSLPNQDLTAGERDYLAQEVLDQLGDEHSRKFYRLVAAKIPEHVIRKALAEIKTDGADNPAKVFTYRMNRYAFDRLQRGRASR